MEISIEMQNMESRLTEMEEKIDAIDRKLTQVVDAILGNPLTKHGGFVHDIEIINEKIVKIEKKQSELDDFKKRAYWTLALVVGFVLFVQYITSIYKNIK